MCGGGAGAVVFLWGSGRAPSLGGEISLNVTEASPGSLSLISICDYWPTFKNDSGLCPMQLRSQPIYPRFPEHITSF